jgi:hypothetical protein
MDDRRHYCLALSISILTARPKNVPKASEAKIAFYREGGQWRLLSKWEFSAVQKRELRLSGDVWMVGGHKPIRAGSTRRFSHHQDQAKIVPALPGWKSGLQVEARKAG